MIQDSLFAMPVPPIPAGIELILGDSSLAIARARELGGARLVVADPPWGEYEQEPGVSDPNRTYATLSLDQIRAHVAEAVAATQPNARLAMWACWPLLEHALSVGPPKPWRYASGGAWSKTEHQGVGFHWLGRSEPVLMWARGSAPINRASDLGNSWESKPGRHSAKPEAWMRGWLRRWTEPGDVVLDLYAGLGGVARACRAEGRRYVGAEIDPDRHAAALAFIAQNREIA